MARNHTDAVDLGITLTEELLFGMQERRERLVRRRGRLQALRNGVRAAGLGSFVPSIDTMLADVERDQVLLENEVDLVAALAVERFGWEHGVPEVMERAAAALERVKHRYAQLRAGANAEHAHEAVAG
jgi:hypothetical protein